MTELSGDNKNNEQQNPVFVAFKALRTLLRRGLNHLSEFIKKEGLLYFITCVSTLFIGFMIVVVGGAMLLILIDIG